MSELKSHNTCLLNEIDSLKRTNDHLEQNFKKKEEHFRHEVEIKNNEIQSLLVKIV
jgi:FtsZ-binding cell division protein ZapB